jgi:predicted  nucleic acid-binding Zn-ribbon protein
MSITKQLYQLQEIDLEIESCTQNLQKIASQMGKDKAVVDIRNRLANESEKLEELKKQQRSIELDIDDTNSKLANYEAQLYSGKIGNPKELANLQQEVVNLKAMRTGLEEKTLEIMSQVEILTDKVAAVGGDLKLIEAEWQHKQQQLSTDIDRIKKELSGFEAKRQLISSRIESRAMGLYCQVRDQKGRAVVKVVQGICSGCRLLLPSIDLHRSRSGNLVQCNSCGRILYWD